MRLRMTCMCAATLMLGLGLSAAQAKDLKQMSWSEVVAAAQAEKEVVWRHWYKQQRFRDEVKRFQETYGIKVTIPDATMEASRDQLLADQDKAEGDIDLLSSGGSTLQAQNLRALLTGPLRPMLPEGDKLIYTVDGFDNGGYMPAFWGNQTCIAYDPKRISDDHVPRTLAQFSDFLRDNPGMFGFNLARGGSGPSFYTAVIRAMTPDFDFTNASTEPQRMARLKPALDWFVARKDSFVLTGSNDDSFARLRSGELAIAPVWEDALITIKREGRIAADFRCYVPDFGMVGGGNVLSIPANAKHKAAALLLVHWLTSREIQGDLARIFGSIPQRSDAAFAAGMLDDAARRRSIPWSNFTLQQAMEKALAAALTN
ncbi:extracellular solute-binding protein [Rhizobium sp. SSA_523]|uniref:extracellular solute-binding protein n=1 Tax=Rhizobium sp. SSA_523 TaxID=2952477 RepID=UPI0020911D61|nr:extracellular solute-binding protein [Rhizobium sp. SSA_523]MCO5733815.1 extracellular solute-binding protein [Rhizobium sp. SSA_523]WKC24911.1 extracellular solute-binding protein [Rhizobium sp. SSA_523]